jgi:transcriptional regulator with XRE-family HTH domain
MKNRIIEFLKMENKSSAQFADEIGVQPSSISHIISGRNNPSLDFVMKMFAKFPALSAEWLLFGKGQMYKEPGLNNLFENEINDDDNTVAKQPGNEQDDHFRLLSTVLENKTERLTERKPESNANRTKRIICFYNDDTFKEYFPDNN